jgi:hypothetical protein
VRGARPRLFTGAALCAILVGAAAASPQTRASPTPAARADTRGLEHFLKRLQSAVDSGDRRAVSTLVRYPATLLASGFNIPVKDSSELIRMYHLAFTPEMRCAIVNSRLGSSGKQAAKVTTTGDGAIIASGLVWAQKDGDTFKITRLIAPPAVPHARPVRQRAVFLESKVEPPSARYSGVLGRDDVDVYVIAARTGQSLYVSIDGFRGRNAALRVLGQKDGQPLEPSSQTGARVWTGQIPATGEYRVEVVRRAPFCDPPLLYAIVMTLR